MFIFTAKLVVKAGYEEEFEQTMRAAVPKVREEPGNHAYIFHRSVENPLAFMFYEAYSNKEAFEAHKTHLKEMGIRLYSLLEGGPVFEFYDKLL